MRLIGDAIVDLWEGESGAAAGGRSNARRELSESTEQLNQWYQELGRRLIAQSPPPQPLAGDPVASGRLLDAVRRDFADETGNGTSTAVRIIWTGDYLNVVRRLQSVIVGPVNVLGEDLSAQERSPRSGSRRSR